MKLDFSKLKANIRDSVEGFSDWLEKQGASEAQILAFGEHALAEQALVAAGVVNKSANPEAAAPTDAVTTDSGEQTPAAETKAEDTPAAETPEISPGESSNPKATFGTVVVQPSPEFLAAIEVVKSHRDEVLLKLNEVLVKFGELDIRIGTLETTQGTLITAEGVAQIKTELTAQIADTRETLLKVQTTVAEAGRATEAYNELRQVLSPLIPKEGQAPKPMTTKMRKSIEDTAAEVEDSTVVPTGMVVLS